MTENGKLTGKIKKGIQGENQQYFFLDFLYLFCVLCFFMKYRKIISYLMGIVITGTVFYLIYKFAKVPAPLMLLIISWTPNISAVVVLAFVYKDRAALKSLLRNWFNWRIKPVSYFAVLLCPVFYAGGIIAYKLTYDHSPIPENFSLIKPLAYAPIILVSGAMGEELGWRGLMLTELRKNMPLFWSSLVITVAWALAHIPAWLLPEFGFSTVPYGGMLLAWAGISIIMCYLVEFSGGSLFVAILVHYFGTQSFSYALALGVKIDPYIYYYAAANILLALLFIVVYPLFKAPLKTPAASHVV